jgi:SAM-dependent methyltransferase
MPKQCYHEAFDEELGVHTDGVVLLTSVTSKNFSQGFRYEPCSPEQCNWAIENAGIDPKDFSFIDIGCGKGRALIIASQHNFADLTGVDYSQKLCDIARANLEKLRVSARIICQDALRFEVPARDVFVFLFNPFRPAVLQKVLDNLHSARRVVIAYGGPGREILEANEWLRPFGAMRETALFRNF